MGFPFEGPAPLEAIMQGCYFLNAKLIPPLSKSRFNSLLFHSPKVLFKAGNKLWQTFGTSFCLVAFSVWLLYKGALAIAELSNLEIWPWEIRDQELISRSKILKITENIGYLIRHCKILLVVYSRRQCLSNSVRFF